MIQPFTFNIRGKGSYRTITKKELDSIRESAKKDFPFEKYGIKRPARTNK